MFNKSNQVWEVVDLLQSVGCYIAFLPCSDVAVIHFSLIPVKFKCLPTDICIIIKIMMVTIKIIFQIKFSLRLVDKKYGIHYGVYQNQCVFKYV